MGSVTKPEKNPAGESDKNIRGERRGGGGRSELTQSAAKRQETRRGDERSLVDQSA